MTELSKTIFQSYQVRKTKQQKIEFIEFLSERFPKIQVEKGGFPKSRNLVFGDVNKAKVVITAHYDTCAALPFPNFITPKNILFTLLYSVLIVIPFFILSGLVYFLLDAITGNYTISYYGSALVLFMTVFVVFIAGKPNKNTANDNTSGVITVLELLSTLSVDERGQYAFVLFDNEESGLFGSAYFKKRHKKDMKNKLLINLDCVGDGDNIMFVYSSKAKKKYQDMFKRSFTEVEGKRYIHESNLTAFYPSDQMNFNNTIALAALKRKPLIGYYMDRIHTSKDTFCDEQNISLIVEGLKSFVSKI